MNKVKRPVLRYFGGKWKIAPWIISYFPKHEIYIEPFSGAASVLMRKELSKIEIYNDIDQNMINLFQVIRDRSDELKEKLDWTLYSRDELNATNKEQNDPIMKAWRYIVKSSMGHSVVHANRTTSNFKKPWFGDYNNLSQSWKIWKDCFLDIRDRLSNVAIENLSYEKLFDKYDTEATLWYCDPPYVFENRKSKNEHYQGEMTDQEHIEFCKNINNLKGDVLVSGYENSIYEKYLKKWHIEKTIVQDDGKEFREEILWIKPNTWKKLQSGDKFIGYSPADNFFGE